MLIKKYKLKLNYYYDYNINSKNKFIIIYNKIIKFRPCFKFKQKKIFNKINLEDCFAYDSRGFL